MNWSMSTCRTQDIAPWSWIGERTGANRHVRMPPGCHAGAHAPAAGPGSHARAVRGARHLVALVVFVVEARRRGRATTACCYVVHRSPGRGGGVHAPGHVAAARRPAARTPRSPSSGSTATAASSGGSSAPGSGSTSPSGCPATGSAPATSSPLRSRSAWRSAASGACSPSCPATHGHGWGVTLDAESAARVGSVRRGAAAPVLRRTRSPSTGGVPAAVAWLRHRPLPSGRGVRLVRRAYGVFRFLVEFVRGNEVAGRGSPGLSCSSPHRAAARWPASSFTALGCVCTGPARPGGGVTGGSRVMGPGCRCATTASTATSTRSARCATRSGPDRPLARGAPAVRLAGRARRPRLARTRLCRPRAGPHPVRRVARDPRATSSSGRLRPRCTARRGGQLQAGAGRVRGRPAGDADPAHVHPSRGPARPLQPEVPHVLRRVLAGPRWRGRAARAGARVGRRPARRERTAGSTC